MHVLRDRRGFTLIELVVAMTVGVILGTMLMTTLRTGLVSFGRISDDMQAESQARAALTLLTVQIRQHDETGAISVLTDQPGVKFLDQPDLGAASTYALVFYKDGALVSQKFDPAVSTASPVSAATVAQIDGLTIGSSAGVTGLNNYTITITYGKDKYGGAGRTLVQTVTQRSAAANKS